MGVFTTLNSMVGRNTWPPPAVRERWEEIEFFEALRDSDEADLRQFASVAWDAPYIVNPLPRLISRASANLLFGEPARFTPGDEADADALDGIVQANELDSELVRAAMIASSEGEVWGRVLVQPALLDAPIIEWVSGEYVIPHFSGRFVVGATFVSEWKTGHLEVHRLLETYEAGRISNALFRGTSTSIGVRVKLDGFEHTQGLPDEQLTGIDQPLIAFIPNSLGSDPDRGVSDYRGLEERFLALNQAVTIGQQNLKIAGRKRALIDAEYLDSRGRLPDGDDVYVRQSKDQLMGESSKPVQLLDYDYNSQPVTAWVEHLIDTTLTYAGVAPQSVGRNTDGGAVSGTALKLKMTHSLMEAAGKGRYFDRGIARLLSFAAQIDARPTTQGGFGRRWADPAAIPTVERGDGLLRDDLEAADIITRLVGAETLSVEEAVRWWRPEWSPQQVEEEVTRIKSDRSAGPAPGAAPLTISTERPPILP